MTAEEIVKAMSLEEKIRLASGKSFWYLEDYPRYGLPPLMMTDGPHGVRKQRAGSEDNLGINDSEETTAYPTASLSACSWDEELLFEMGAALGEECVAKQVSVLLGPGANMKRDPLCGRNFEYFSEDPVLAGKMAAAWIRGVQSVGVGTSLKHFAGNNQEFNRMTGSSNIDPRALREYYLPAFEIAVKEGKPATVMCSYNQLNGVHNSGNAWLLRQVLRDEWGFEGVVVTDWGAGHDHTEDLKNGLNLEMPGNGQFYLDQVKADIESGKMSIDELDAAILPVVRLIQRCAQTAAPREYDKAAHHEIARKIAAESIVLMKNDGGLLPLAENERVIVIGELAEKTRYQGAGSSFLRPYKVDTLLEQLDRAGMAYEYAPGYRSADGNDDSLLAEAVGKIQPGQKVIVCVGLTDAYESEGFDRKDMRLPPVHDRLVDEVCKRTDKVIAVLCGGSPVELPWADKTAAIVNAYLSGEAGASAVCDILLGKVEPSGKLAETWPMRYGDAPTSETYGQESRQVNYRESLFVGYRYYDSAKVPVRFPFGHGLSYTTFRYDDLEIQGDRVRVKVTNTGSRPGAEVCQLYISNRTGVDYFPSKELRRFQKIRLNAGETKTVTFELSDRDFSYFRVKENRFVAAGGNYQILIGASSADIRLSQTIVRDGVKLPAISESMRNTWYVRLSGKPTDEDFARIYPGAVPVERAMKKGEYTIDCCLNDLQSTWIGRFMKKQIVRGILKSMDLKKVDETNAQCKMTIESALSVPLRAQVLMSGGAMPMSTAEMIVAAANGKFLSHLFKSKNKESRRDRL